METTTYWVTLHGDRRHASHQCANGRRAITSGTPTPAEGDELPLCAFCCDADAVAADVTARRDDDQCENRGVTHPQRVQSECRSCGKRGTVNQNTGRLRAHKAAR